MMYSICVISSGYKLVGRRTSSKVAYFQGTANPHSFSDLAPQVKI